MDYVVIGQENHPYGRYVAGTLNAQFLPAHIDMYKAKEVKVTLLFDDPFSKVSQQDLDSKRILFVFLDDRLNPDSGRYLEINEQAVSVVRDLEEEGAILVDGMDCIMPYMYYCRQDKKFLPGEPLSIKDVAKRIEGWGIDRLYTLQSHLFGREDRNLQMYFDKVKVHDIGIAKLFADRLKSKYDVQRPVIINPDDSFQMRIKSLLDQFEGCTFGYVTQDRDKVTRKKTVVDSKIPELGQRDVIVSDDLTDTGGTLIRAVNEIKKYGPKRLFVVVGHMFDEEPLRMLADLKQSNSFIQAVLTSDSFYSDPATDAGKRFAEVVEEIPTYEFLAEQIRAFNE